MLKSLPLPVCPQSYMPETCSFLVLQHHAADTYKVFTDTNEDLLKSLPPPVCALEYYRGGDLYMFDAFMTTKKEMPRRPPCK
jgi:ubiquinol oxidase